MKTLGTQLLPKERQEGFTLVEVVVAMFIFTLVMTGSLYAMVTVLQVTRDNRSSQVASNLAAEEIDLSRDIKDLFDLLPATRTVTVNGDQFTVTRETSWVSDVGDIKCATGGGALRYKRVNVTVSWANMRNGVQPVQSDTVIDSRNRINDPTLGTILVSALNGYGTGSGGVKVEAKPAATNPGGAVALTADPEETDTDGCSYILKVKPGRYDVKVSKASSIDLGRVATSEAAGVEVRAGESKAVPFVYGPSGRITLDFSKIAPGKLKLPDSMDLSFRSSLTNFEVTRGSSMNSLDVLPTDGGYQVLAGKYIAPTGIGATADPGCVSVDPLAWQPTVQAGKTLVGQRPEAATPAPAGSATAEIAMAAVQVPADSNTTITVTSAVAAASTGDPGCSVGMTYKYTLTGSDVSGNKATIAVPYGSWKIYKKSSSVLGILGDLLGSGSISVVGSPTNQPVGGVLTLDPRKVQP